MSFRGGFDLRRLYAKAKEGGYGFTASNITNFDIMIGLLRGSARKNSDLVLQVKRATVNSLGDGDGLAGLKVLGEYLRVLSENYGIGVFLNVDHLAPEDMDFIEATVESAVPSSIMIDASHRPFEENVKISKSVKETVKEKDREMLVEAELGRIKGEEGKVKSDDAFYTDPAKAVEFVERTGCDLLAISIGTQHGVSKGRDLELRQDIVKKVDESLRDHGHDVSLVLHGASGLLPDQVKEVLDAGVCKLNKNTRYQYEYTRTAFDLYRGHRDAILPPEGVEDDRDGFFSDTEWSPDKRYFNPHVATESIRDRIADLMAELTELTGSAGKSLYE